MVEIGGILEKSVGRDCAAIKLIAKVRWNWRYYACTDFSISNTYYSRENDWLAGTGQENNFSGNVRRDLLCLIMQNIKQKEVRMLFESKVHGDVMQKLSILFVNNNDLVTDWKDTEENMQVITTEHNDLHSVAGEDIEEEKSKFYAC